MKYKKYILFGYLHSCREGGLEDIVDSFDTQEEARRAENDGVYGVSYIIDRDTWEEPAATPSPEERIAKATTAAMDMVMGQGDFDDMINGAADTIKANRIKEKQ